MENGMYKLYKKYAGICLLDNETQEIFSKFKYYSNLMEFLSGKYYTNYGDDFSLEKNETVNYLSYHCCINYCLLSEMQDKFSLTPYYLLYLFYDSFLVVASINLIGSIQKTQIIVDESMPIIIPYDRIKTINVVEKSYAYTSSKWDIEITYKNSQAKDILHLFRYNHDKTKICGNNAYDFDFLTNSKRLNLNPYSSCININLNTINTVNKLLLQYVKSREIMIQEIPNLFSKNISKEIKENIYYREQFMDIITSNLNDLKDNNSSIGEIVKKYQTIYEETNNNLEKINKSITEYNNALIKSNFVTKKIIEIKLKNCEKQKAELTNKIDMEKIKTYNSLLNLNYDEFKLYQNIDKEKQKQGSNFYKQCIDKNVIDPTNEKQKKIFSMLYKMNNIENIEEALELYKVGKMLDANSESHKEDNEQKHNDKLVKEYYKEKELAQIIGYDKYIKEVAKALSNCNNKIETEKLIMEQASLDTKVKATTHDPAIMGGMVNGLLGAGAGLYTALSIQEQNEKARKLAYQRREKAYEMLKSSSILKSEYMSEAKKYQKFISEVSSKVIDIENKEEYFKHLGFSIDNMNLTDNTYLNLEISFKKIKPVKINNIEFIVDGSVHIKILKDGKTIGDGYLSAPGYNNVRHEYKKGYIPSYLSLSEARYGYNQYQSYNIICILNEKIVEKDLLNIEIKIEPYNLWIIEK